MKRLARQLGSLRWGRPLRFCAAGLVAALVLAGCVVEGLAIAAVDPFGWVRDRMGPGVERSYGGSVAEAYERCREFTRTNASLEFGRQVAHSVRTNRQFFLRERSLGWTAAAHDGYFFTPGSSNQVKLEIVCMNPKTGPAGNALRAEAIHDQLRLILPPPP